MGCKGHGLDETLGQNQWSTTRSRNLFSHLPDEQHAHQPVSSREDEKEDEKPIGHPSHVRNSSIR